MHDKDPPNPYIERALPELFAAAMERAGDLLKSDRPIGRRDTAHLLITMAHKVGTRASSIGSPAHAVIQRQATPSAAFGRALEEQQSAVRWLLFQQMLDAVGGVPHGPLRGRLMDMAGDSDAGFRAAALELDAVWATRQAPTPGESA